MDRQQVIEEVIGVIFIALAVLFFLSLASYTPQDLSWYSFPVSNPPQNIINVFGAYLSGILYFVFGWASYLFPLILFMFGVKKLRGEQIIIGAIRLIGLIIVFLSFSSFFAVFIASVDSLRFYRGGIVGLIFSDFLINYFGATGAYVVIISLGLLSLPLVAEISVIPLFSLVKQAFISLSSLKKFFLMGIALTKGMSLPKVKENKEKPRQLVKAGVQSLGKISLDDEKEGAAKLPKFFSIIKPKIQIAKPLESSPVEKKYQEKSSPEADTQDYKLPTLDLLDSPPPFSARQIKDDLESNARVLEDTLNDFGISTKVVNVERGPVITRYELELAPGVKVQKILALSDDISLVMKASSVRIVAPIPGKAAVGVEVPNSFSTVVYFKELLGGAEFKNSKSKLMLALGKDISGKPVLSDLVEMPHLLIAGTTGSGKTVCVNTIIMSLLFNYPPSQLKFVMIDPKMVELSGYNGLPHLLCPVITDAKKASSALNWVVGEMEERYKLLAKEGVRNIEYYNQAQQRLPYIVIIIDELADLMMVARDQIENTITRLAQLSRAVGIHLVLATQRPSVDVITGVIKANFPARISFKVASKVDSRTVLDGNGADKLLGRGDMLFLKPGEAKLIRAQGSYLQDKEIKRVFDYIMKQSQAVYDEEIVKAQEKSPIKGDLGKDELFDQAVELVLDSQQASVSILQRRLRLGYTRAARLIDMMEEEGIVGCYRGSKPREILMNKEAFKSMKVQKESV